MKCDSCGKDFNGGKKICPYCGGPTKICEECGHIIGSNDKCPECGKKREKKKNENILRLVSSR